MNGGNLKTMISKQDPNQLPEHDFISWYLDDILTDKENPAAGVEGCILAIAYSRAQEILTKHGVELEIVMEIRDPEVELTYLIKSC